MYGRLDENEKGDFYFISNLDRGFQVKHVGDHVRITGSFSTLSKRQALQVSEFKILKNGSWKTVWHRSFRINSTRCGMRMQEDSN
jgi:hypothetical protein